MPFRQGQWVKLVEDFKYEVVVDGETFKRTIKAGTVGINHIPTVIDGETRKRGGAEFHLLDETGFTTIRALKIPKQMLRAVRDRNEIPAGRLATMDPNWKPKVTPEDEL